VSGRSVIVRIVQPVRHVLNGVTVSERGASDCERLRLNEQSLAGPRPWFSVEPRFAG
jgi:hypothetical protein